ncbi:MAG: hypothetical protein Hyperionvirus1_26 [Hyperionvirus sp.]|uniref:Uncharacterized protein n=1 Tax=Hyperionvirus sp. TaxID=2487770 RepID=A0A3G5A5E4_9VIRU|nr:MAG: hypothetical protein Hyperionvirus1_26 [Hyperionvirus sp.]
MAESTSMLRVFEQILGCEAYFEDSGKGLRKAKAFLHERAKKIEAYDGGTFAHEIQTLCVERICSNQVYDYEKDRKKGDPFERVYSYGDDDDDSDDD